MHSPLNGLTFCVHTFGCQMNKHDSERIAGMLEALGAQAIDFWNGSGNDTVNGFVKGEDKLNLIMLDDQIPAGSKLC